MSACRLPWRAERRMGRKFISDVVELEKRDVIYERRETSHSRSLALIVALAKESKLKDINHFQLSYFSTSRLCMLVAAHTGDRYSISELTWRWDVRCNRIRGNGVCNVGEMARDLLSWELCEVSTMCKEFEYCNEMYTYQTFQHLLPSHDDIIDHHIGYSNGNKKSKFQCFHIDNIGHWKESEFCFGKIRSLIEAEKQSNDKASQY